MVGACILIDVCNPYFNSFNDRIEKSLQIWNCFVVKWENITRTKETKQKEEWKWCSAWRARMKLWEREKERQCFCKPSTAINGIVYHEGEPEHKTMWFDCWICAPLFVPSYHNQNTQIPLNLCIYCKPHSTTSTHTMQTNTLAQVFTFIIWPFIFAFVCFRTGID